MYIDVGFIRLRVISIVSQSRVDYPWKSNYTLLPIISIILLIL